jgi:hypothetical protein
LIPFCGNDNFSDDNDVNDDVDATNFDDELPLCLLSLLSLLNLMIGILLLLRGVLALALVLLDTIDDTIDIAIDLSFEVETVVQVDVDAAVVLVLLGDEVEGARLELDFGSNNSLSPCFDDAISNDLLQLSDRVEWTIEGGGSTPSFNRIRFARQKWHQR